MRRHAIVAALVSLALVSVPAMVAAVSPPDQASLKRPGEPGNDRARGLVFDALREAGPGSGCAGAFEIIVGDSTLCTHGPDAAPPEEDVRAPRSVAQLRLDTLELGATPPGLESTHTHGDGSVHDHAADAASADTSATAEADGVVPVFGDGVSGNRVQAIYAVAADRADRFGEVAPLIATWAAHVDDMVDQSAALTGGERHVRYVTDANGALDIKQVVLPVVGDDTFSDTISALRAAGYTDPSRKYLIWTDASVYCGIGTIYGDDRPTQDNANNGRYAMYSRVDTGCWGRTNSTELHEIVHNMGGVQQSAPHVTPNWHCTDDYDLMCYPDSSSVVMSYDCPASMEALLDCGSDDYFHTSPPPGSYLDSKWNVANSSFLHAGVIGDPPPPPTNSAPVVTASAPASLTLGTSAALAATVTDDGLPGPHSIAWSQSSGPGQVTFANPLAEDTTATFSASGTYLLTVTADDGELTGTATVSITVDDEVPPVPTEVTEIFSGSLNKKWPERSYDTIVADGPATATLSFSSKGGGRKTQSSELTITVHDANDGVVATAAGPSALQLSLELSAGVYRWEVTGANTSFTLEVTHAR